jgi:serine/threonine protein kinase
MPLSMGPPSLKPGATLVAGEMENLSKIRKFDDDYKLVDKIQKGSFGIVFVTHHKETLQEFAVKVIDRANLKPKDDDGVFREVHAMQELLEVPNIVSLIDFYETPKTFHVVQVYAKGGDVFDRLAKRVSYNEKDARDLGIVLLSCLQAMHDRRLCHRDLKPENLLLLHPENDSQILLADFGFTAKVPPEGLKTRCGTPAFVAPEIIVGNPYKEQVDMWSAGCLLYMLIGGYPPFQDESHRGLFRKIRAADFTFHDKYWSNVSVHAKKLISQLLTVDPSFRLTAKQALGMSSWLQIKAEKLSVRDLSASLGEFKRFNARRKLKSAMHAVMWSVHTTFRMGAVKELNEAADKWDAEYENKIKSIVAKCKAIKGENGDGSEADGEASPTAAAAGGGAAAAGGKGSLGAALKQFTFNKVNRNPFVEVYELGEKIHSGTFAVVYICKHKASGAQYAVKVTQRDGSEGSADEIVLHEVGIMNSLEHPNIVKVVDFFEEIDSYYIVMEEMAGGDVFDRIMDNHQYTEKDARDLGKILLQAVAYLHKKGIAHRDLKPQNLLLQSKEDNAMIKIADFGFARRVHTPKSLNSRCGTPSYVSPEILKGEPYDQSCDMWSVGVILYVLMVGFPPFLEEHQERMFDRIKAGDWSFEPVEDWSHVSEEAKDLIRKLLVVNADDRLTAEDALKEKWMTQDDAKLMTRDLSQSRIQMRKTGPLNKRISKVGRAFMNFAIHKNPLSRISSVVKENKP